jgi:hypothetical protein
MKAALRDVLLILLLFGAIALAPVVADFFPGGNATPAATPPPAISPPPPRPSAQRQAQLRPLQDLSFKPDAAQSRPSGAGCSLGGIRSYRGGIPRHRGDTFILPGAPSARGVIRFGIQAGRGVDMLKVDGPGSVDLNGEGITGVEIIDLLNNAPNTVSIFPGGLTGLEGAHVLVIGDAQDTVYLDSCLRWDPPLPIEEGGASYLRHDGHDDAGNIASVSVTKGVRVEPLKR